MKHRADMLGTLAYIGQRVLPFSRFGRGRHRATGLMFTFDKHDFVGRRILRYQTWEREMSGWLEDYLAAQTAPGLFIDVGANIGWFSLLASRHAAVERVLAFEPDPTNAFLLDTNVAQNRCGERITTIQCALGAGRGFARLGRYKHSNLGQHSLLREFGHGNAVVLVDALDAVLDGLQLGEAPIACMKIDVEGYEPKVIEGARGALARTRALVVELSRQFSEPAGLDYVGMIDAIAAAGFRPVFSDYDDPLPDIAQLRDKQNQSTIAFVRDGA